MKYKNPQDCPITKALSVLGGKWKLVILSQLRHSPKRFGQLDAMIPKISRKVLTSQLNELVKDGLVTRRSYPESPPRVEYHVTEKAKKIAPIFEAMSKWGTFLMEKDVESDELKLNNN